MNQSYCPLTGNTDMYGFGIRLGFYLQWVAGALAALLMVKPDVAGIRSALFGFSLATFIAVIYRAAKFQSDTAMLDIYISLLLCFGFFYFILPQSVWRLYLWARKIPGDETKRTVLIASPEFDVLQMSLLLAVTAMKIWFWATMIARSRQSHDCPRYGFLFYPYFRLDSLSIGMPNIIIDLIMVFPLVYELMEAVKRYFQDRSEWVDAEIAIIHEYVFA